jgi:tetratricopeptide (TPR) repeat protein
MENVEIRVGESGTPIVSDAEGKYAIEAIPGDVLYYSYTGMKDYRIRVEDVTRFLNIMMVPDVQELEGVTVTGSNRKSQRQLALEYATNPRLLRTAYGIVNPDNAPGRTYMLMPNQINPITICVLDLLRNRFPGLNVQGDCQGGGAISVRGQSSLFNSASVIFDVDGQIFINPPIWIDVNIIKRLAVFNNLAMTSRYGAVGIGGVVVINTVNAGMPYKGMPDLARKTDNYLSGKVLSEAEAVANGPTYLKELEAAASLEAAKQVYWEYETRYAASPYFFLDAISYFSKRADGDAMAESILADHRGKLENNAVLLKGLAYMHDALGAKDQALELYKEIFILRPHYSQSYMDLARAYREAGFHMKSAGIYARYKLLLDEGFLTPTKEFGKIMQHESDNLLSLEGGIIGTDRRKIQTDPFVQGSTRVVVEWNDSEAEFDLQFVNPEGQYTFWKHTYAEMEERIMDEKDNGYSMAEFVIDENLPGTWTVNAIYRGNKSLSPTYLKVTTYVNYGERSQQKDVQTFRLQLKDVNQRLFSLNNPGRSRVR